MMAKMRMTKKTMTNKYGPISLVREESIKTEDPVRRNAWHRHQLRGFIDQ